MNGEAKETDMKKKYLEIGKITKLQGLKGEVRVQYYCDEPEMLCDFDTLYLGKEHTPVNPQKARYLKADVAVLKLKGVDTPEDAEKLIGKMLYFDRDDMELPEDTWFIQDIIGLEVYDADSGKLYGKVETVNNQLEVQEIHSTGDKAGPYTVEDYIRVSADRRVELINGYLYDLASPTSRHQMATSLIMKELLDYAERHDFECMPYQSPLDVRLNRDNRTMLQPDLFVICQNDAVDNGKYIEGAPDFVIEVLSPSTAVRDMKDKLNAYFEAGVREYWVIDPDI